MKKWIALLMSMSVMLTGCSLAVEETRSDGLLGENGRITEDQLVGVVVTTEYLDLFDMESYLADHPEILRNGGIIDTTGYEGRIYAQEVVEQSTTDDGKTAYTTRYNFDHVEGIPLLYYECKDVLEDGTLLAQFTTGECGEGLWDVTFGGAYNEGTIYVPRGTGEVVFYINPVYQQPDGKLYLVPGTGIASSDFMGSMSENIKQEYTITMNGEQETRTREFKITVKGVVVPDMVTILQIDENHQILDSREYTPETVPGELTPVDGCAYILVEEHAGDGTTRTLLQPGSENHTIFRRWDKDYCTGTQIRILWPEE